MRQIAARLNRAPSTISRELRRNGIYGGTTSRSMRIDGRHLGGLGITGVASRSSHPPPVDGGDVGAAVEPATDQPAPSATFPENPELQLCHDSIYKVL